MQNFLIIELISYEKCKYFNSVNVLAREGGGGVRGQSVSAQTLRRTLH